VEKDKVQKKKRWVGGRRRGVWAACDVISMKLSLGCESFPSIVVATNCVFLGMINRRRS
jgi:hypothetical protein